MKTFEMATNFSFERSPYEMAIRSLLKYGFAFSKQPSYRFVGSFHSRYRRLTTDGGNERFPVMQEIEGRLQDEDALRQKSDARERKEKEYEQRFRNELGK